MSCSFVSMKAKNVNKKLVKMMATGCQQLLVAKDEGSVRLTQPLNPRYRFLLENIYRKLP